MLTDKEIEKGVVKISTDIRWHGEQIEKQNAILERLADSLNKAHQDNVRIEQKVDDLKGRLDRGDV